ncbi:hypothetical protein [Piscinibacter gummiphilus]|uniref:Uncharacterized protein n=1 Tax=Piscinibacter gummiphilus TaxID=946333 RepID=A0ABZ0D0Z9_9BURK|nr:hypothetical protein [Piscinibacter gummiphilus]WOB10864.1 hypothetical protein RXV79_12605 [Piscinibacter gummiphilus]
MTLALAWHRLAVMRGAFEQVSVLAVQVVSEGDDYHREHQPGREQLCVELGGLVLDSAQLVWHVDASLQG